MFCWNRSLQGLPVLFVPVSFLLVSFWSLDYDMLCLLSSVFVICVSWVFHLQKDWAVSSFWLSSFALFNPLHVSSNSWFAVSKLFKHVYASLLCARSAGSHFWLQWDPRSRHHQSSQGKQSRSHKTFSSQRRELRAEDRRRGHGSQRCCLSTLKLWWMQCCTMTWCNGMQWPGIFSFHFVALCFDLKVKLLWFPWFFWILMTVCLQPALIRIAGMCFLQTLAGPWKLISEWWSWAKLFFYFSWWTNQYVSQVLLFAKLTFL